jgi:hypothetical protein
MSILHRTRLEDKGGGWGLACGVAFLLFPFLPLLPASSWARTRVSGSVQPGALMGPWLVVGVSHFRRAHWALAALGYNHVL